MARIRLAPELRREQLLDLGAELFAAEPYERVHIERVAEMAGVSRGLLYHYFPTKAAFFGALVARTVEHLRAATAPDPALSPLEQLRHGIDAYLAHCRENSHAARAVHRGAASADPDVVAIIERDNRIQEERILAALEHRRTPHPLLVIAVRAWLRFLRTAWLEWIDRPEVPRDELREVCVAALVGALGGLPRNAQPARLESIAEPGPTGKEAARTSSR
jgi:AcrR family transcriptional regulator